LHIGEHERVLSIADRLLVSASSSTDAEDDDVVEAAPRVHVRAGAVPPVLASAAVVDASRLFTLWDSLCTARQRASHDCLRPSAYAALMTAAAAAAESTAHAAHRKTAAALLLQRRHTRGCDGRAVLSAVLPPLLASARTPLELDEALACAYRVAGTPLVDHHPRVSEWLRAGAAPGVVLCRYFTAAPDAASC
jgi:hypothetical protein